MSRKKDPKLLALTERRDAAQADFERLYSRFFRAFNRMEKARKTLTRLRKQVRDYTAAPKETIS